MDQRLWERAAAAIAAAQAGETDAEQRLRECWSACNPHEHALRCIIAHHLADLQQDPVDELEWDQRALEAHDEVTDEDLGAFGIRSKQAFLPSLHLNLGDDWLRVGDRVLAHEHLRRAQSAAGHLGDDRYGEMIRRGLHGLADRLAQAG